MVRHSEHRDRSVCVGTSKEGTEGGEGSSGGAGRSVGWCTGSEMAAVSTRSSGGGRSWRRDGRGEKQVWCGSEESLP